MKAWLNWRDCPFKFDRSDQIHIWLLPVQNSEQLLQFLTKEEIQRANKFRVQSARDQFIVARVALRILLQRYFHLEGKSFHFKLNQYGKPYVDQSNIFSMSPTHTNGY